MSSVDDRIVNMQFNSKDFSAGATNSLKSLDALEKGLQNASRSKGLDGLATSVDGVKNRFSLMQIAGVSAVATIASKATAAGLNLLKSFTLEPVMAGFQEYQTGLNSIQTIMANTGKSVDVVNKGLDELNDFADQTIYNFGQMAKNVGTFTAAGVDLETSISSIKGISQLAAVSGSTAEQASTAMYQLSQAIAAGRVGLQDWNSVVNAGMGGKVFQQALSRTAVAMGTLEQSSVALVGPMDQLKINGEAFRQSISASGGAPSWLTSEVLTTTLDAIAAGYSVAELKAMGFDEASAKAMAKLSKDSFEAATQIKTLPQLVGVIQESIGSTWSGIFRIVLGDFEASKKLWTSVGEVIVGPNGFLTRAQDALTGFFAEWAEMGGRGLAIDAFKDIFEFLINIFARIKRAFQDIFPPGTGNALFEITKAFRAFADAISIEEGLGIFWRLRVILGGFFSVLHIGFEILGAITGMFTSFFGEVFKGSTKGSHGILDIAVAVARMITEFDKFITKGDKMTDVFKNIGSSAGTLVREGINIVSDLIAGLVEGISGLGFSKLKDAVIKLATQIPEWIKDVLGIHSPAAELVPVGENIVAGLIQGILTAGYLIGEAFVKVLTEIPGLIMDIFGDLDPIELGALLNTFLAGGILLAMRKLVGNLGSFKNIFKQGIIDTFQGLTDTLKAMQQSLKAEALMRIAIAVGVLTASLVALSFINPKDIAVGLGAIGTMVSILVVALAQLAKVDVGGKIAIVSTSFITMATAILILSGALAVLALIPLDKLIQGVGAITILLAVLTGSMASIAKFSKGAPVAAAAMISMAIAVNLLVGAITALGLLPADKVAQGIGFIAAMLAILVGTMVGISKFTRTAPVAAGAMIAMAVAINLLVAAVIALGLLPFKVLAKGIGSILILLTMLTAAMVAMSVAGPASAIAAAGMIAIATAIGMLVPLLILLGSLSLGTMIQGLVGLAVVMGILTVAIAAIGFVATAVAPGLLALGAAVALVGLGMLAFGTGFAIMAAAGVAGVAVLITAFEAFMALLPTFAAQLGAAFVAFLKVIAAAMPKIRKAIGTIISEMLGIVIDAIPEFGAVLLALIEEGIRVLTAAVPQFIEMGFTIIDEFLKSAAKHAPDIVDNATDLITTFLKELGNHIGEIISAAAEFILDVLHGIADAIDRYSADFRAAGLRIAGEVIDGLSGGLASKVGNLAGGLGGKIGDLAGNLGGLLSRSSVAPIEDAGTTLGFGFIEAVGRAIQASTPSVVASVVAMANAIIAEGNAAVLQVQRVASEAQRKADFAQARAEATAKAAKKLEKSNPKLSKELEKRANKQQNIADALQAQADAAAERVGETQRFENADFEEKGDIRSEQAIELAKKAQQKLEEANANAAQARKLQKINKKLAEKFRKEAEADAKRARELANQAREAERQAQEFYKKSVDEQIAAIEAEEKARKDQEAFEKLSASEKLAVLDKRAEEEQAKADAARAEAARLLAQAKEKAATDARAAQKLVDAAEEQRRIAEEAARAAEDARSEAERLRNTPVSSGGGSIVPSRSVLEDAASVVDRYSESLSLAEQFALAGRSAPQFIQNNYSPEALPASEIYRNTRNLISTAEIKMGSDLP